MIIEDLQDRLARIFVQQWSFHEEYPNYFALKQQQGERLRTLLQGKLQNKITFMEPANDQNFYLVGASLSKIRRYRFELWKVSGKVDVWYIEVLLSVVAPVIELCYHHYLSHQFNVNGEFEHQKFAAGCWNPEGQKGIGPALEADLSRFAQEIHHHVVSRTDLEVLAPADFPSLGVWDNSPNTLRDYVFPGVLD